MSILRALVVFFGVTAFAHADKTTAQAKSAQRTVMKTRSWNGRKLRFAAPGLQRTQVQTTPAPAESTIVQSAAR